MYTIHCLKNIKSLFWFYEYVHLLSLLPFMNDYVAYVELVFFLKAVLEEADIRVAEIKKEEYEFERDIVRGASNLKTGTANAEKVIKYLEERLRARVYIF